MSPGATTHPLASITASSSPRTEAAKRASTSPMRAILSPMSRTDWRPRGSGAKTSPFSMRVSMDASALLFDRAHRARLGALEALLLGEAHPHSDLQLLEAGGIEDGVAVEVDLAAIGSRDEAETLLGEDADHLP